MKLSWEWFVSKRYGSIQRLKYTRCREETVRNVTINDKQQVPFCSNIVKTTKYTLYTFPFKNLFEQLCEPSNLYFVFIAILQAIPKVGKQI